VFTSGRLVIFSHMLGAAIVLVSALGEVLVLVQFHEAGPITILVSITIGVFLVLISLVHSGFRLQRLALDFQGDLVVLCGQESYWDGKSSRTTDDVIRKLREL
jgi:hypothetical protein